MERGTNSVGAARVVEMLLGEEELDRWTQLVPRFWGFLFVAFAILFIWLPVRTTPSGPWVAGWIAIYLTYLIVLEVLGRRAKEWYETNSFRLVRIHFNLVMLAALILMLPSLYSNFLWFFLSLPILAAQLYFGNPSVILIVYLEVCIALLGLTFVGGWPPTIEIVTVIARIAILGLLAATLYFFTRLSPRIRGESALSQAATLLISALDQEELCQLLVDAAKTGIPAADAAVVHLLGGEDHQTLLPKASTHIDPSSLGDTLMAVGKGIAGHALQDRETISVPNVDKDERYVQFRSHDDISSLLVSPMYVGDKNIGTISVHSHKLEVFDEADKRFLTTLAAQGATAAANVELFHARTQRRRQISDILEASRKFGLRQSLDVLLDTVAAEICRCSGYQAAVVNLVDEPNQEIVVRGMAGLPEEGQEKLEGRRIPLEKVMPLLQEEFQISQSYFIRHNRYPEGLDLDPYSYVLDLGEVRPGEWHPDDMLIVPIRTQDDELLGYITVDAPLDRKIPTLESISVLELLASVVATAMQNAHLFDELSESTAFNKNIVQTLREGILVEDADHLITYTNPRMSELLGFDPSELRGRHYRDIVPPQLMAKVEEETAKRPQGISSTYEAALLTKDGQAIPVIVNATPSFSEDGEFAGVVCAFTDISDRKLHEARLQDCLSAVTGDLAQFTAPKELYRFIVETGAQFLSAQDCCLFLLDEGEEGQLELAATTAPSSHSTVGAAGIDPNYELAAHVVETRQPARFAGGEVLAHPFLGEHPATEHEQGLAMPVDHHVLAAPISIADKAIGAMIVQGARGQDTMSDSNFVLLETLSANTGAAIERMRSIEQARQDAIRTERIRLESDLHEAMNVLATGVRWEAEILSDELLNFESEEADVALMRLQAALTYAYADLRSLLEDLRDPVLEQEGLLAALKKRGEVIGRGHITVQDGLTRRMPPKIESILYRVGKEAMNNSIKHSGAKNDPEITIDVWLEQSDDQIQLCVQDNGLGFDPEAMLRLESRWGLRRLRDTVREMGGRLDILSEPKKGAAIYATISLS